MSSKRAKAISSAGNGGIIGSDQEDYNSEGGYDSEDEEEARRW